MSDRIYEIFLFDIYLAITKIKIVSSKYCSAEELQNDFVSWDSIISGSVNREVWIWKGIVNVVRE
jgi:hypothetical protein